MSASDFNWGERRQTCVAYNRRTKNTLMPKTRLFAKYFKKKKTVSPDKVVPSNVIGWLWNANLENVGSSSLCIVVTIRLFAICWQRGEETSRTRSPQGFCCTFLYVHRDWRYGHIPNRVNGFDTCTMLPGLSEVSLATKYSELAS